MDMLGGLDVIIFVMFVVPLVLGALGAAVMFVARARRHPHPACRGCGCDVTALADTDTGCPECGAAFSKVGIRPRREPRRSVPWSIGVLLLLLGLAIFVSVGMLFI